MKKLQFLAMAALVALFSSQAVAQDVTLDSTDKEIASEILLNQSTPQEHIDAFLDGKIVGETDSRLCRACVTLEGYIGDPDNNCGGNGDKRGWTAAAKCTFYMTRNLKSYIERNQKKTCEEVTGHLKQICEISTRVGNLLGAPCKISCLK